MPPLSNSFSVTLRVLQGDSGGPLIQQNADGDAEVIGVVSWGLKNCGTVPFPSVFTRTSAYTDWIQAVQQQNAQAPDTHKL